MEELKKEENILTEEELDQVAGGSLQSVWVNKVAKYTTLLCKTCGLTCGRNSPKVIKAIFTGSAYCSNGHRYTIIINRQEVTGIPINRRNYISNLIKDAQPLD